VPDVLTLLLILLAGPAHAQDTDPPDLIEDPADTDVPPTDGDTDAPTDTDGAPLDPSPEATDISFGDFDLDTIFVAPIRAQDSERVADARALTRDIVDRLAPDHLLLSPIHHELHLGRSQGQDPYADGIRGFLGREQHHRPDQRSFHGRPIAEQAQGTEH